MNNKLPNRFQKVPKEIREEAADQYHAANPTWEALSIVLEDMMEQLIRESESDSWLQWPGHKDKRIRLEGQRKQLRKILNLLPTETKFKE